MENIIRENGMARRETYLEEEAEFQKQAKIAYDQTCGQGIRPEAVPDLLAVLNKVLEHFYNLNNTSGPLAIAVAEVIRKAKL